MACLIPSSRIILVVVLERASEREGMNRQLFRSGYLNLSQADLILEVSAGAQARGTQPSSQGR